MVAAIAMLGLLGAPSALEAPKTAAVSLTVRGTAQRLAPGGTLTFVDLPQPPESLPLVVVDPTKEFQTLIGIGGALTDAAAEVFDTLPAAKQEEVLRAFFDPRDGLGYSLARTSIHSCDFSSGSYTYVAEGDRELKTFDVAHDRVHRLPLIKRAIAAAGGKLTLFASPWSPPAWMKDNHDMLRGGRLLPAHYQTWADYFVKFIRAYESEGVPIWGVTVQNEPAASQAWESCLYTAAEERDFLKHHLGPTLARAGLGDRKILVWDHNRDLLYQRASAIFDDPEAAKYAWGVAYHWYEDWAGGQPLNENVRRVQEAFPGKPIFFSEGCVCPDGPQKTLKLDDWALGEKYGREMIKDFNNGTVAWTDWNVMLDERGGPNHVGNFCYAPLHIDTKTHALRYTNIYFYLGHFSKFLRPGARRVAASSSRDQLLTTAFRNPDGTLAVVVMNQGDKPADYTLWVRGRGASASAPPHSIATFVVR